MEQSLKGVKLYLLLILIMVVIIGIVIFIGNKTPQDIAVVDDTIALKGVANPVPIDIVGTKIGTSTVGVDFSVASSTGQSATSTYPYLIGNNEDSLIYSLYIKAASSTANLKFSFLGSNDSYCDTTATASSSASYSTYGGVFIQDINWFDLGDHLKNKVHSTSLSGATSTIVWDTSSLLGSGREIILEDLNSRCAALQVSGSSTVLWAQLKTKDFK